MKFMFHRLIKKLLLIFFLVFIFVICQNEVKAASIGVKPKEINLFGFIADEIVQEILIFNVSQEPGIYTLSVDGKVNNVVIAPNEFPLDAGGEKLVKIITKSYFPKHSKTSISVVSRSPDASGLSASVGLKIPMEINYNFSKFQLLGIFCLAIMFVVLLRIIMGKKERL